MKELRAKLMINSCNGASRRRAKPTISAPGPPVRRAPEEPEGLAVVPVGGGGARAGLEIDHSEPSGSRVAVSRAGRRPRAHKAARPPRGARNTSGATSNTINEAGRRPRAHKAAQHGTQREAARPHRDQAAHASGDSCQKPRISQRSRWRRRGRPRR